MKTWIESGLFIFFLALITPLLGQYMASIFRGEHERSYFFLSGIEKSIYRLCHFNPFQEMTWKEYAKALFAFNACGFVFLFLLLLLQGFLPLNPQGFSGLDWPLAFNTAASFVTNTNWQAYGGENTLSYLSQMSGLTVQNFLSAATGNAVMIALIRGINHRSSKTIGNFWKDMTRTVVYLLLPLSFIFAIFLVSQGVIQNFNEYVSASTLESEIQLLPQGPVASQVAIKQLGTNGGGFFNANSAHPYENPTIFSNFFELLAIVAIPAATIYMYGLLIKSRKEALVILGVICVLLACGFISAINSESVVNPILGSNPVMEGKEVRFGSHNSILWTVATSATSNGSVNAMLSSLSPLAGGVALFNMMIGEVVFGGIGVGLCSMLMFVFLTVFIAGLMVGRTPEYLGKKIEKCEMQWVMIALLTPAAAILIGSGIAIALPMPLQSLGNSGPHGLTEILYAFSSAAANNGSSFAGLNSNTVFYNLTLSFVMLITRAAILIPSVAIAGGLAEKNISPASQGTFSTKSALFGVLLLGVIVIVAALTFFPALSLGPIVEQILMEQGRSF